MANADKTMVPNLPTHPYHRGGPRSPRSRVGTKSGAQAKRRLKARSLQPPQFNDFEIDNWSGRKDSNLRPPGAEPRDSDFAGFCTGILIFQIVPVQLVSSMGCAPLALRAHGLSWRLWLHEKGKVYRAPAHVPGHRSDPPGLCGPEALKKLTKPGALMLNLSSTYSTVRLIDVACRASVSATNSGSSSYRLRRNVLGPIAVIE